MLVELKKLKISSDGHSRTLSFDKIYVNTSHVISITDCDSMNEYLLSEGLSSTSYSLVHIEMGNKAEEIIVLGTSEEVHAKLNKAAGKRLLNG